MKISLSNFIYGSKVHFKISEKMDIKHYEVYGRRIVFNKNPIFEIELNKCSDGIRLKGIVKLDIDISCVKCLDLFNIQKSASMEGILSEKDSDVVDDIILIENDELDLNNILDIVLIDIVGENMYCKDDCQGLCSICGINLNRAKCSCDRISSIYNPEFKKMKDLFL